MNSTNARWSIGKLLIFLVAIFTAVSPYLADWNETHIYNPLWLPHAKFHNAQTDDDLDEYVRWYSEVGAMRAALQYYRKEQQDIA